MEGIILNLLVTDTTVIQQATVQLREAFKNPESTRELARLIVSSANVQVRQYAALLLRKRYSKSKNWSQLDAGIKAELKVVLLQALMQEAEKSVKNSVVQLIGVVVKHELPKNGWPEALALVHQLLESGNFASQELGMYTLSIMTEMAPEIYLPHAQTIMELINKTLHAFENPANPVACYALDIMLHLVPLVEGNQIMVNAYHQLMPRVMQTIHALSSVNPDKAIKSFELLDELCENSSAVVSPHIKNLVDMSLLIANDESLDEDLRSKAIIFIGWLTKTKKKAIMKHKLVEPIVDMLFRQMCVKPDDETQEVYFTCDEDNTPVTSASQSLDLLALHLPPEKLVPFLLKHIEPGLEGADVYKKKASYLSLAVIAEGCAEYIRTKYLESFLRCICQGITDPAPIVRNAALFALGQFSEHLQPEISRYASELLPVLLQYLSQICAQIRQDQKELPSADRMFYALEIFAENLNEDLLPYLPTLMGILFEILEDEKSPVHVRELAMSAIGAAANASKADMLPYMERIVAILQPYLMMKEGSEEVMGLQNQAVDTLGVLARTIGEENFAPLALKSLEVGMKLLKQSTDPDLKKSVYGLLASISTVMKKEMSAVLPEIVEQMILSLQSSEGIVPCFKEDENGDYLVYEDSAESGNDEEDIENSDNEDDPDYDVDEDIAGYNVENVYLEEKEEAILALREIAEHTEEGFLPYLENSFSEVFKLISYPEEDIRKAAVDALMQFCLNFSKIETAEGREASLKALALFVPKLSELVRLDEERSVAIQALESFAYLFDHLGAAVLVGEGHKEAAINCVLDVMQGRTQCQDQDEALEVNEEEGESEPDELLFECAGQLLRSFGKVAPNEFKLSLQVILPILIKRIGSNYSESQRSYSIGTIDELLPIVGDDCAALAAELLPVFMKYTADPCDDVRSNAIFGLGELAYFAKDAVYSHFNDILQVLSNLIAKEANGGARDNIIGAIARLIITNSSIIPLEQVFPVFLNHLPLKDDLEENKTVFKCIHALYREGNPILRSNIKELSKISVDLLVTETTEDETKNLVAEFLRQVERDFAEDWNTFYQSLPAEVCEKVKLNICT